MQNIIKDKIKGRGSQFNLPNRFEKIYIDHTSKHSEEYSEYSEYFEEDGKVETVFFNDNSKSILSKNESPDLGLGYSINPYRGCEHGCIYCYARPTHEYLGFSSGLDFETKIMVKRDAPGLLEEAFNKKSWIPQSIFFSGNTDCYQPVERKLEITRKCLEVFLKFRNPVSIITKNALIKRDVDILKELAKLNLVRVVISITTLKKELQQKMEPRTSTPERRLEAIEFLNENGIITSVNVAPIIPGLTDEEIPAILKAASERGAVSAGRVVLRLPHSIKDLFSDWVKREFPDRANKILNRISEIHGGKLYDSTFGKRMTGEGEWADTIQKIFNTNCNKYNLNKQKNPLSTNLFRRINSEQIELFE
ncbi:MAG: PA0069 family radical SAM protein [Ignavibacteria bacterium]|nr:PA0069 family radical SAM protein [Ignavibacteria bacterium]